MKFKAVEMLAMGINVEADASEMEDAAAVGLHALVERYGIEAVLKVLGSAAEGAADVFRKPGNAVQRAALSEFARAVHDLRVSK